MVEIRIHEHTMFITLRRAAARNAFTIDMALALEDAIDTLDADPQLRVAVLQAEGAVFCAGQDLKEAAAGRLALGRHRGGFGIFAAPPAKPLIAAVEGAALAGGMELLLCCDIVVASRDASFGLPEVRSGLVAIGGACIRLPRRLVWAQAMELLLTGEPQDAAAMQRFGLVNRVVEPGTAAAAAMAIAASIAARAPLAVQASKRIAMLATSAALGEDELWQQQTRLVEPVMASADLREGLRAFAEKRPPVFSGA